MFEVTATVSYWKDGAETRAPYIRQWSGIAKEHVVDQLEARWIRALGKLNGLSSDVIHGNAPVPETTNPVEMRMDLLITEDGEKWCRTSMEWPKMGIEQQEALLGIFNGELSGLSVEVKSKESKGKTKGKK